MSKLNFRNKWVVVTGASSGLGRAIAVELASKEGSNLIIAARRAERLDELKKNIESEFGTMVVTICSDLSDPESVKELYEKSTSERDVYAIINNAGITDFSPSDIKKFDIYEKIIEVNFKAVMKLSLLFLDYFRKKGEGAILNITSMGGLFPLVYQNVYCASKHASQVFTEILSAENENRRITISSFAPGGIVTEMLEYTGLDKKKGTDNIFNQRAEKVARSAVRSFKKGKLLGIPGFTYNLGLQMKRILPRKLLLKMLKNSYK